MLEVRGPLFLVIALPSSLLRLADLEAACQP